MSRYNRTITTGSVAAGEVECVWRPRYGPDGAAKRGVLLCHGAGTDQTEFTDITKPGSWALGDTLASLGFYVVSADLGGSYTLCNDTVVTRMAAAWTLLKTLGCKTDKAIGVGVSMGGGSLLSAARAGVVPFSLIMGIIPLADLDDVRDNNRTGLQSLVNTAWGLTAGSTSATVPLPARANPNTYANTLAIAANCSKVYLSYSTADTVIIPSTVTSLAAKLTAAKVPTTLVQHSVSLDHSEASVTAALARPEFLPAIASAA